MDHFAVLIRHKDRIAQSFTCGPDPLRVVIANEKMALSIEIFNEDGEDKFNISKIKESNIDSDEFFLSGSLSK